MRPLISLLAALTFAPAAGAGAIRDIASEGMICWAVGDAGTALRSRDGGRTWQAIATGTRANFEHVQLVGRAALIYGGEGVPGHPAGEGVGVLLASPDGGRSFRRLSPGAAGWLYGGSFAGRSGALYGQGNPSAPAGLWVTIDGGKRWHPGEVAGEGFLLAGDLFSPRFGYLVGRAHRIVSLRQLGEPALRPPPVTSPSDLRAARFADERTCWVAGDGGTVYRSRSADEPWDPIPLTVPAGVRRTTDVEAVAAAGPRRIWLAGGMTGTIARTDNAGGSWTLLPAPKGRALHALTALDARTLLAGGDGACIWRSSDGGRSWQLAHGREGTDVLFLAAAGDRSLYPALVAHARAGCSTAVVFATTPREPVHVPGRQPLRAAAIAAGADGTAALTDFASALGDPTADGLAEADILRRWSLSLDVPAEDEFVRQLAAAVRLYRPLAVAVGPVAPGPSGPAGEARLVARLARRAVALAGEEGALADLARAHLPAWRVRRVFVADAAAESWTPPWADASTAVRPGLAARYRPGRFPGDANLPLGLLAARATWHLPGSGLLDRPGPGLYRCEGIDRPLRLFTSGLADRGRIVFSAGTGRQRRLATHTALRAAAMARRTGSALPELRAALADANTPDELALASDRLLLCWHRLMSEGKLIEADTALAAFAAKGSPHPLGQRMDVLAMAAAASSQWKAQLRAAGRPEGIDPERLQAAASGFSRWPAWALSPAGRMLHAHVLAAAGRAPQAAKVLRSLAGGTYDEPWRQCALLEMGDVGRLEEALRGRTRILAPVVAEPGRLDGELDEPCWQAARAHPLRRRGAGRGMRPPVGGPTFRAVQSAPGFVLFALRLPRAHGRQWGVEIAIDSDRDAWTQTILRCDSRGGKSAALAFRHGPTAPLGAGLYHLAVAAAEDAWTLEIAVGLSQFAVEPPETGLWYVQVRAVRRQSDGDVEHLLQPQPDGRPLPERYAFLRLAPRTTAAGPAREAEE